MEGREPRVIRQKTGLLFLTILSIAVTGNCAPADAAPLLRLQTNKYAVAGITDAAAAERFLRALQQAVAKNDRNKVAAFLDYPITVNGAGYRIALRRPADLLKRYDAVFNRKVKSALASQRAERLFVNDQGVMIGSGEIWFNQMGSGRKASFKITAINH